MLKLFLSILLVIALVIQPNSSLAQSSSRRGKAAGYSTRDATVLSMMCWGIGLGVGIGLLCGLIHTKTPDSANGGGNGHNAHSH